MTSSALMATGLGASLHLAGAPEVRRILVLKWSAMGDVVLATVAFEDIRRAFPEAELHLSTLPPWDRLFAHDPRFARVIGIDVRAQGWGRRAAAICRWLGSVRAGSYDLVIDLQSTDRSRILLALLWILGRQIRHRLGNWLAFPYNLGPAAGSGGLHALQRIRAALGCIGIPPEASCPVLHPPPAAGDRVQALLQRHGLAPGRFAVFLPGCQAAGYLKRWGSQRYAALARLLHADGLDRVVLIGGPDEVAECAAIAREAGDAVVDLCGQTELLEIVPLCAHAQIVVGNDTGTAHVAAAAGRPMIVICGPTDPRRVKPAGPLVRTLQAALPCINCYRKTCAHHSCMRLVTAQEVRALAWSITRREPG